MGWTRRTLLEQAGGAVSLGAVGLFGYGQVRGDTGATSLSALVAGSLLHVAEALGGAQVEAHGSAAVRQLIRNDMRDPDAVALADPVLFDGIADRVTLFATNALVLAHPHDSPHAAALEREGLRALEDPALTLGRTDPDADPLGYRTVLALRLAARESGLDAERVLANAPVFPEVDLLNVVERGEVDAAVVYRNMAVQRDLPTVELPDRLDFSDPAHAAHYATVSYELPDGTTVRGAPIRYGATATTDAGKPWVERLVTAHDLLGDSGFVVPEDYPRRGHRVGNQDGADEDGSDERQTG